MIMLFSKQTTLIIVVLNEPKHGKQFDSDR